MEGDAPTTDMYTRSNGFILREGQGGRGEVPWGRRRGGEGVPASGGSGGAVINGDVTVSVTSPTQNTIQRFYTWNHCF